MRPKKSLGQNFLMHRRIAERIADAAELTPTDTVLEIGPGTGMLTRALLDRAGTVIAVEADHELVAVVQETFAPEIREGRLVILNEDIRNFDTGSLEEYKLVANIPYYLTGEIIRTFLTAKQKPSSMTLLVQKEVAERIAREKKESMLSISVKAYGTPKYRFTVPRGAFRPAPNVDSAVLSVLDIRSDFSSTTEEERFFEVVRTGFMHKRKQLAKNLEALASAEAVKAALTSADVPEKVRPEEVPCAAWRVIASQLAV